MPSFPPKRKPFVQDGQQAMDRLSKLPRGPENAPALQNRTKGPESMMGDPMSRLKQMQGSAAPEQASPSRFNFSDLRNRLSAPQAKPQQPQQLIEKMSPAQQQPMQDASAAPEQAAPGQDSAAIDQQIAALQAQIAQLQAQKK